MTYQGRSLDDQPLAAYSTGVVPDEADDEALPEPPHLTQQDAVALAMGIEPAAAVQPEPATDESAPRRRSKPRPSLPRFSLPRISLRARRSDPEPSGALAAAMAGFGHAPLAPTPAPTASRRATAAPIAAPRPTAATMAAAMPMAEPMVSVPEAASAGSVSLPRRPGAVRRRSLDLKDLGATLRNPRAAVRDPRVLAAGVVAIGLVVLGASVLLGGGPGGLGAADASPSAPAAAAATAPPGAATVTLSGSTSGTYELAASTGFGRPADDQLNATWTDAAGSSLTLVGRAGRTRATSGELVLTWTVVVDGTPVTFTSDAGECTVGMAVKPASVTGTFVCPELKSDNGKLTVKVTGTYRT